jgi:ADP-Ribosyltransferase in polyvalent proteins
MALTPEQLAELQRLRQMFAPLAEQERRRQQATANAEAMANKKAKGGSAKSKFVLDESGKPLRVYHGTNQNIQSFSNERLGANSKTRSALAHFFTEDPREAGEYAAMSGRHQFAEAPEFERKSAKLQKDIERAEARGQWDLAEKLYAQLEQLEAMHSEGGENIMPIHLLASKVKTHDMKHTADLDLMAELIKQAKAEKMHALKLENVYDPVQDRPEAFSTNQWVMFDPKRIKSAIGNRGNYDPKETDITKAQGGTVSKNPFDYQNKKHLHEVAKHLVKHGKFPLPKGIGATDVLRDVLSSGKWQTLDDPRINAAMRAAGHDSYYTQEKTGKQLNPMDGMAKGGEAKAKKPTVDEMKRQIFEAAQANLQRPSEVLGQHEGKYLHLTEADRAAVENRKHGLRGGVGFSQIGLDNPEYAGRVWGVGKPGVVSKLLNKEKRGLPADAKSVWSTFIGAPEMHTSNQLVFNRMWNKFQEARKQGLLSPEQEQVMLNMMRQAMTKEGKNIFDPDVSFDKSHHLFDTFERRRVLSDLMAGKQIGGKKGQIFDASKVIEDTTDPKLLHAPTFSVGPHAFEFSGETSHEPHLNKAFPYMLHGTTTKHAFKQMPFEMAVPEYMAMVQQLKGRKPGYMDIVRNIPRQHISEKYLTGLQKAGYADGGNVDIAEIGVNEAPNLPVKAYSPFANDDQDGMPFGGVDLNDKQSGQQLMSPMQIKQLQAPAPQAPQTPSAPQPAGSNILQMTKQGQAMAAMRPTGPTPAGMKRGGKVTMPSTDGMRYALTVKSKKAK